MTAATSRTTQVYHLLVAELRVGTRKPGAAISVKDAAQRFKVSPTPVREALERLVGEGVVMPCDDRTGFIVPRIGVRGFTSLTDTFCLLADAAAMAVPLSSAMSVTNEIPDQTDAARATETVFDTVLRQCPNTVVIWMAMRLSTILAPYRAVEPGLLTNWAEELEDMRIALRQRGRARAAIRGYRRRRHHAAAAIVDRVEQGAPSISNIAGI